jgi:hypothetical protein
MGLLLDDLDDHEGYADRRLADGRLAGGVWTHATRAFTAYVAARGCGWHGRRAWPPTEDGEDLAAQQWRSEHGEPELARQAERGRDQLARVLAWLGDQAGRLQDPAAVARVGRTIERAGGLVEEVQRDLERQAPQREADGGGERPLAGWSDRRVAEHGRAICQQRRLPTEPEVAGQQAAVLEEWARRWRQRGPRDTFGEVELGLIGGASGGAAPHRRRRWLPARVAAGGPR